MWVFWWGRIVEDVRRKAEVIFLRYYHLTPQDAYNLSQQVVDEIEATQEKTGNVEINNKYVFIWCRHVANEYFKVFNKQVTEVDLKVTYLGDNITDSKFDIVAPPFIDRYDEVIEDKKEEKEGMRLEQMLKLIFPSKYHSLISFNIDYIRDNVDILPTALSGALQLSRSSVYRWLEMAKYNEELKRCLKNQH